MLMLGEVLALSRRSADALDAAALPETLREAVARAADAESVSPQDFLRIAVADFDAQASAEDWSQLMSRVRDEAEPGRACLHAMLEWWLRSFSYPGQGSADEERESRW
jgi:hypothetical protein